MIIHQAMFNSRGGGPGIPREQNKRWGKIPLYSKIPESWLKIWCLFLQRWTLHTFCFHLSSGPDWMQVLLYSLFIARGAESNPVREERHRIPHDDIWNQKCFTGSTESGPDMFPTWNRTKWSSRYTTCSILVFQHTLDKFFCRIIQIYSKTLKPEENNKKQKITTETCDGRHICSRYNCEVLGKRQNKT